jgi:cyclopropane-fatty-acyl-phospholipid synthase
MDVSDRTRWPAMRAPHRARARAALAQVLLRRVAARSGIRIDLPDGRIIGPPTGPTVVVLDAHAFFTRLGRDGKIGFGEAYMAGDWDSPQLVAVLEALADNVTTLVPRGFHWLRRFYDARHPVGEDNDRRGAKRNISRHYNLSNELFATFLDQSMTYSSACFDGPDESLEAAQARKIDNILDMAAVQRGSRVLEIGTGWGGLALRAARRGAHVTSVTLSEEQATFARRKIEEAGLAPSVDIRVQDYRDVTGQFDAIVSVEMIEAVGEKWWPTYFRRLDALLAPTGKIGIQSIVMDHARLVATRSSWTWIHKYIFPGGLIPSRRAIDETLTNCTTLRVTQDTEFGPSYALTLKRWREHFVDRAQRVDQLGFDATFRRMWTFYLAYSEAGFRSGYLNVVQLRLDREGVAVEGPRCDRGRAAHDRLTSAASLGASVSRTPQTQGG